MNRKLFNRRISELIGKDVYDSSGTLIGSVADVELKFDRPFCMIVSVKDINLSRHPSELTVEADEIATVHDVVRLKKKRCPACLCANPIFARYCRECGAIVATYGDNVAAGKGFLHMSVATIANSFLGLALFFFLVRMLTPVELGVIAAVTLSYTVFQYLGQVGLDKSAASLVSAALTEGVDEAGRVLWAFVFLSVAFSVISTIPAYLLASTLANLTVKDPSTTGAFQIAALIVLANALASNLEGILQGIRDFTLLAESRLIGQITRIAISLVLLFGGYRVLAVIIGLSFGPYGFATIAVQIPILLKRFRVVLPRLSELIDIVHYSLPLYGVTLLSAIAGNLDLAILISRGTTAQVGAYSVVLTIVNATTLIIFFPIQASLVPFMSKILKEKGRLEESFKTGSRYLAFTIVPLLFGLASSSQLILLVVAGSKYPEAILPLSVAMLGLIALTFTGLVNACLQAHGKNTSMLVALGISSVGQGVFGYWVIPIYGLAGAALTRVVQEVICVGMGVFLLRRVMLVGIDKPTLKRMTLASCSFLIIPLHYLVWNNSLGLVMLCLLSTVVFLVSLKFLRPFTPDDVTVILRIVPRTLNPVVHALRIESLANWLTA